MRNHGVENGVNAAVRHDFPAVVCMARQAPLVKYYAHFTYTYIYIRTYIYIYVYVYIYTYIYMYLIDLCYMCVIVRVPVDSRSWYMYTYVYIYEYTCIYIYM